MCPLVLAQTVQAVGQLVGPLHPRHPLARVDLEELGRQSPVSPGARELGRSLAAGLSSGGLAGGGEAGGGGGPITLTVGDDPLLEELLRAELINVGQGVQGAPGRPVEPQVKLSLKKLAQPGGVVLVLRQSGEQNLQALPLQGTRGQAGEQILRVAPVPHPRGEGPREEDGGPLRIVLTLEEAAGTVEGLSAGGVAVGHLGVGPQGRLEPCLTLSDDSQPQPAGRVVAALREFFIQTLCLSQVTVLVLPGGGVAHQPGGGRQLQAAGNGTPHFSENSILTHDGHPYFSMNITRI